MPYGAMLHRLATTDVHPPLYFTILWASIRLIGDGDVAVRVPSIVAGVLLIPLVYLLGKEAYDRRTGAVAAVFVSVAPFVVWYSQEARMYELSTAFGVLAVWAQLRILRRGGWYPCRLHARQCRHDLHAVLRDLAAPHPTAHLRRSRLRPVAAQGAARCPPATVAVQRRPHGRRPHPPRHVDEAAVLRQPGHRGGIRGRPAPAPALAASTSTRSSPTSTTPSSASTRRR